MQRDANLQTLLVFPFFVTVEVTRAALWAARAMDEPDRDGPLLRAFLALLVGALSVVPRPVWGLVAFIVWLAWLPFRGALWILGIGRGGAKKRSPIAVTRWYAHTRRRRAELLEQQQKQYLE